MRKGASELKDLDVDRVDGVDKPATGRNFLLFKGSDGDLVMKSYGALASVAHEVLAKARTDKNLTVSRKSAVALNGLAQVLGEDAVFVGKSIPTQPYEFSEPDTDKRGPADEDLGGNFSPRSMPGSMVGSVAFRLSDAAVKAAEGSVAEEDAETPDEEAAEGDKKRKWGKPFPKKAKAAEGSVAEEDAETPDEEAAEGDKKRKSVAADPGLAAMAKAIEAQTVAINKILGIAKVEKSEGDEQPERKPRSRQVEDDAPVSVRKGVGGYEPRFGVSFADVAFARNAGN
jgi:hypothetical protein